MSVIQLQAVSMVTTGPLCSVLYSIIFLLQTVLFLMPKLNWTRPASVAVAFFFPGPDRNLGGATFGAPGFEAHWTHWSFNGFKKRALVKPSVRHSGNVTINTVNVEKTPASKGRRRRSLSETPPDHLETCVWTVEKLLNPALTLV